MKGKPPFLSPSAETLDEDQPQSKLAEKLASLKTSTLRAVSRRERLPQPLFWSLFHTEVNSIKERRKEKRRVLAKLYNIDWL